ncbi:hypothetical protein BTW15_01440 [Pseudomonas syringae pv. tomato]|uniref:Methylene-tetrahydrofolate reductase C-terminal domain-containing protein n=1 Tax=Pseudomonas syringae pv. tomato TaxID=323 RepID=A0AB36L037_PSEUB|nr:hypothetical protein [Pseudomonas syringae group genomosp. 3]KPB83847.1 Unknown protein sequence [Pseudomonas syringae pv. maculicola]MBX6510507.1 hypothetical protein [Pseudomonas syringae pv. tomato]OPE62038.1 hypothetical protein BTW15_01440 [Pseudomonas syringae pv. tomato]RMV03399.1 hypothetical protein ALP19_03017 [Pseudomonas syringae pv. tomato]
MWEHFDKFFDALGKAAHLAYLKRERVRINSEARPKCGNCSFWMKSRQCPAEKNVNGQSRGPSCEGFACQKFEMSGNSKNMFAEMLAKNEAEIQAISI